MRPGLAAQQKFCGSVRITAQFLVGRCTVADRTGIFSSDLFKFFRELGRNNQKAWMDENREGYRELVVAPFRVLLRRLEPAVQKLNAGFMVSGRVGENFSRINRDIRFARDKSPYRTQMYLLFAEAGSEAGQLYVGISGETVTCGFRIYSESRTSRLVQVARPRGQRNSGWIERQRGRLGNRYESYWYTSEKGQWTKHKGWPVKPEDWKKLQGWVVRRKFAQSAALRGEFPQEIARVFREVYPLYEFTGSPKWKQSSNRGQQNG
jgi:uncharacterized protein (TIGR02453 family)